MDKKLNVKLLALKNELKKGQVGEAKVIEFNKFLFMLKNIEKDLLNGKFKTNPGSEYHDAMDKLDADFDFLLLDENQSEVTKVQVEEKVQVNPQADATIPDTGNIPWSEVQPATVEPKPVLSGAELDADFNRPLLD